MKVIHKDSLKMLLPYLAPDSIYVKYRYGSGKKFIDIDEAKVFLDNCSSDWGLIVPKDYFNDDDGLRDGVLYIENYSSKEKSAIVFD